MNKRQVMFKMVDFFNEEGKILDLQEYRALGVGVPIKDAIVRRYWGSWKRIMMACEKLVKFEEKKPEPKPFKEKVIEKRVTNEK